MQVHLHKKHIMNQQTILQSNLLDIIFENRNKEYGAYSLRKSYQSRLTIAVLVTVSLAISLSLLLLSQNPAGVFTMVDRRVVIPDTKVVNPYFNTGSGDRKEIQRHSITKRAGRMDTPPVIAPSNEINTLAATPGEIEPSVTGSGPGMYLLQGGGSLAEGSLEASITKVLVPAEPNPVETAEIMPQYPGGVQALLSFLKKNIHSPNIEEGEDISVKIEFVVNYDGTLENFRVMQSGGDIFDIEVLRVFKKMPLWIPGKSKGKNIAVHYVVPVKFTSEF